MTGDRARTTSLEVPCSLLHSSRDPTRGFRLRRLRRHRRGPYRRDHARSPEAAQRAEPRNARRVGLGFRTRRRGRHGPRGDPARRGPVVLRGTRSRLLRRRARTLAGAGPAPHLSMQRRNAGRSGVAQPAGVALLLREHQAVAQPPQDHRRRGARDGPVGGTDAGVVLRSHRRGQGHGVRRRRRHPARDVRRRVLRPPVGVRAAQGEGATAHRRLARTPTKPTPSEW